MPVVKIPTPLREYADDQKEVTVEGSTVREAMEHLSRQYAELDDHLFAEDDDRKLRQYVNIYLNSDDIRTLEGEETKLEEEDTLHIVPAIAGGSPNVREQSDPDASSRSLPPQTDDIELSKKEIERYSRHFLMPDLGEEGQKKLKAASVLMVGAGGLGAPFGMYMAAAGIGRLGMVDFDEVEYSNLQRQLLHGTEDVGRSKLQSARERLHDINPNVEVELHEERLTSDNAREILTNYDVVVDGTDNFQTRYLVNDACAMLGIPNVYGSIFRFEGQVSVFDAERGPCYRCLYEEPPPPGLVPDCAEGGVLGVLPGIIGSMQALETIKLITDVGEPLIGRYLLFDARSMEFQEMDLPKNPDCPVCGEDPERTELIDYEQFCGVDLDDEEPSLADTRNEEEPSDQEQEKGLPEISAMELHEKLSSGDSTPFILDVRTPQEVQICRLEASRVIPMGEIPERLDELPDRKDQEIVVHCRSGKRSAEIQRQLKEEYGYENVYNLRGGILAWARHIDEDMPVY